MTLPVGASQYYDSLPSRDHESGDVWSGLPTFGVLPDASVAGVIITPACDLAHRKVETLTYLPVVAVGDYVCSRSFLPEILRAIDGQLKVGGIAPGVRSLSLPPSSEDCRAAQGLITERLGAGLGVREDLALKRAQAGLAVAVGILEDIKGMRSIQSLRYLFGERDFSEISSRVVTNSHRIDVHFLPSDDQPIAWSTIPTPSVSLFRYPLSLPVEMLDAAAEVSPETWPDEVRRLSRTYPCAHAMTDTRPLKGLRIRPRFLADLLTRFTGLYVRIGSPDFSESTVAHYTKEIEELR
jgi:hypothetical protein